VERGKRCGKERKGERAGGRENDFAEVFKYFARYIIDLKTIL